MLDRVRAFTEKYQMIRPGDRIVAAYREVRIPYACFSC